MTKPKKVTKRRRGQSASKTMLDSRLSHKELLTLLGEIDGIDLRSLDEVTVAVFLRIGGKDIEIIRDSGSAMSHSITRIGIAGCLESNAELRGAAPEQK